MDVTNVEETAKAIAERLRDIKNAEKEKIAVQSQLDSLSKEINALEERLNRLDALITSKKYEITHKLSETNQLSLVKVGD